MSKEIIVGNHNIDIHEFSAWEALKLRNEIVAHVKSKLNIKDINPAELGKAAISLIYELPESLVKKLFAKTSNGSGSLDNEDIFNEVFARDIDSVSLVLLEVMDYNCFFTTKFFIELMKKAEKMPFLKDKMKNIKEILGEKGDIATSLEDLMTK
tara:strand:+ start:104 stop:565 length:462 start_codon:yes stop_codon:yes gene_type:complete